MGSPPQCIHSSSLQDFQDHIQRVVAEEEQAQQAVVALVPDQPAEETFMVCVCVTNGSSRLTVIGMGL